MVTNSSRETISFTQVTTFEQEDYMARAEAIGQVGEADAREADSNARASDRLIETIKNAQIADIWKPRRYGGVGGDMQHYSDMIRTISRYDMAAGWLTFFYSIHEVWVGYMLPEGREEVYGDGGLVADVLAPVGRAEADGDGYRLSGQWNFSSGVLHSTWVGLGAMAHLADGEGPEYCLFIIPVSECEIVENWDTLGMRGTGSHGISLEGALIPAHRVLTASRVLFSGAPMGGDFDAEEPIYRMPFLPFFAGFFPAVSMGGADRVVEEFQKRTESRTRVYQGGSSSRTTDSSPRVMAELRMRQYEMEGLIDSYLRQLETWRKQSKVINTAEEKALMFALRAQVARGGVDIAVKASQMLGGTAMFKGVPVELFTRDLITLGAHSSHLYEDAMTIYGGSIFGGPAHPVW